MKQEKQIKIRGYEETDFAAVNRIWDECGWLPEKMDDTMQEILSSTNQVLGEIEGSVEAVAMGTMGSYRYLDEEIKANLVDAVTVSLVARKTGLARRCLAELLAQESQKGCAISVLSMFEQGYYNRLGYGNGTYYRQLHFDPADLMLDRSFGIPVRLGYQDFAKVHASRLKRKRTHGGFNVITPIMTKSEMAFTKKSFGLGYFDKAGELTHHIWIDPGDKEVGPFRISWMSYQNYDQLMELLALIRSFNDQVREVSITEPAQIQLVDLLRKPMRKSALTRAGKYHSRLNSYPIWQARILDLKACMSQTRLDCQPLEFNLMLRDPLDDIPTETGRVKCSGNYHIKLGNQIDMGEGLLDGLPVLEADTGAFTRLWLGVRPATGLAATDNLKATASLLKKLDKAFCLPEPQPDWWF